MNKKQSKKVKVNGDCTCLRRTIFSYNHALISMPSAAVWRHFQAWFLLKLGQK